MKHSNSVDFMNNAGMDLASIMGELLARGDGSAQFGEMLGNIEKVIGRHEFDWISRNGHGRLAEYVVERFKFKTYPGMKKLGAFPLHLLIEPTSVCNLRCRMCFQSDGTFRTGKYWGMMDLGFFKHLVDQAVECGCKFLTLASRGEPTLHSRFGEMLRYCRGKFLELKINTNATRLDERTSLEILEAGTDIVVFSVDSHSKEEYEGIRLGARFEEVLGNIRRFCELKGSKPEYAKTATRVSGVYLGPGQSKGKFSDFWREVVDTVTMTDAVPRRDTYNNERMDFSMPCGLLWERMYVWHDGICNPCDFDYKSTLKVGDAKRRPLKDIWLGETYQKHREMFLEGKRRLMTPCNRCNVY
jgi:MoaA/NifB/PqqE/SkfB family radical SAM enzyme